MDASSRNLALIVSCFFLLAPHILSPGLVFPSCLIALCVFHLCLLSHLCWLVSCCSEFSFLSVHCCVLLCCVKSGWLRVYPSFLQVFPRHSLNLGIFEKIFGFQNIFIFFWALEFEKAASDLKYKCSPPVLSATIWHDQLEDIPGFVEDCQKLHPPPLAPSAELNALFAA